MCRHDHELSAATQASCVSRWPSCTGRSATTPPVTTSSAVRRTLRPGRRGRGDRPCANCRSVETNQLNRNGRDDSATSTQDEDDDLGGRSIPALERTWADFQVVLEELRSHAAMDRSRRGWHGRGRRLAPGRSRRSVRRVVPAVRFDGAEPQNRVPGLSRSQKVTQKQHGPWTRRRTYERLESSSSNGSDRP